MITATTPDEITYFRFASIKQQLKLEKLGMKSSGGSLRPRLAAEFGLKPRAPHDDYIAYCQAKMDALYEKKHGVAP